MIDLVLLLLPCLEGRQDVDQWVCVEQSLCRLDVGLGFELAHGVGVEIEA